MADQKGRFELDFMPIGQAIKKAREAKGMTREQLAGIIGYAPRHIQAIENEGQYPSFELLFNSHLYSIFPWIKLIFPDSGNRRSAVRQRVNLIPDSLTDKGLSVIEATANGLRDAREHCC